MNGQKTCLGQLKPSELKKGWRGPRLLEKGFNSDVKFRGENFHVQTEDWGIDNPFLVSRVYCNGAVIKSLKISYREVLPTETKDLGKALKTAMQVQHQQILDLLISGQLF